MEKLIEKSIKLGVDFTINRLYMLDEQTRNILLFRLRNSNIIDKDKSDFYKIDLNIIDLIMKKHKKIYTDSLEEAIDFIDD